MSNMSPAQANKVIKAKKKLNQKVSAQKVISKSKKSPRNSKNSTPKPATKSKSKASTGKKTSSARSKNSKKSISSKQGSEIKSKSIKKTKNSSQKKSAGKRTKSASIVQTPQIPQAEPASEYRMFNNLTNDYNSKAWDQISEASEDEAYPQDQPALTPLQEINRAITKQKEDQLDIFGLLETHTVSNPVIHEGNEQDSMIDEFDELAKASQKQVIPISTVKKNTTKKNSVSNRDPTPMIDRRTRGRVMDDYKSGGNLGQTIGEIIQEVESEDMQAENEISLNENSEKDRFDPNDPTIEYADTIRTEEQSVTYVTSNKSTKQIDEVENLLNELEKPDDELKLAPVSDSDLINSGAIIDEADEQPSPYASPNKQENVTKQAPQFDTFNERASSSNSVPSPKRHKPKRGMGENDDFYPGVTQAVEFNDIYTQGQHGNDPYELGLIDQPSEITPESLLNFDTETNETDNKNSSITLVSNFPLSIYSILKPLYIS